jgi:demethylmenaquinone methyltransferase/2-methoxy-6-polyprenyl-1,4-benzoquinol methylase
VDDVLKEQLDYYRARATEYDQSLQGIGSGSEPNAEHEQADREWLQIVNALRALGPVDEALELACGTGIWTRELMAISRSVTALDGSPEMIEVNRSKTGTASIDYQAVDLFQWEPDRQYDLVFFAFWLSHVPPSHLPAFLDKVARATKPGRRIFIVDEPQSDRNISGPNTHGLYQQRTLNDGRSFQIVKVYYEPQEIERNLVELGFKTESSMLGRAFFCLCLRRDA